jgi:proteic killer suppression protein
MIVSFRHKGLKRLFEDGDRKAVSAEHVKRIENILSTLDEAEEIEAMDLLTFRLHPLIGDLKGFWSVVVRAMADHLSLRGWRRI